MKQRNIKILKVKAKRRRQSVLTVSQKSMRRNSVFHLIQDQATQEAKKELQKYSQYIHEQSIAHKQDQKKDRQRDDCCHKQYLKEERWEQDDSKWLALINCSQQQLKQKSKKISSGTISEDISVFVPSSMHNQSKTMFTFYKSQMKNADHIKEHKFRKPRQQARQNQQSSQINSRKLKHFLLNPDVSQLIYSNCKKKYKFQQKLNQKRFISQIVTVMPQLIDSKLSQNQKTDKKYAQQQHLQRSKKVKSCIMNTTYLQIPVTSLPKRPDRNRSTLQHYNKNKNIFINNKNIEGKISNLNLFTDAKMRFKTQQETFKGYFHDDNENRLGIKYGDRSRVKIQKGKKEKMRKGRQSPKLLCRTQACRESGENQHRENMEFRKQFERLKKLLGRQNNKLHDIGRDSPIKIQKI